MSKTLVNRTINTHSSLHSQRGASLVEYVLLLALIAAIAIGAMRFFGESVSTQLSTAAAQIGGELPQPDDD